MKIRSSFVTAAGTLALALAATASIHTQSSFSPLPTRVAAPADNPTTADKVELGRLLFWDPILSGPRDVACATCHHPDFGYAEPLDLSIGTGGVGLGAVRAFAPNAPVRLVKRNSQTVLNAAFNGIQGDGTHDPSAAPMFWDLRVQSLEAQALEPIKALEEMRGDTYAEDRAIATVVARLAAIPEYRQRFTTAFGGRNAVTEANLGRALAAFQRTLVTTNAPFDRYMRGDTTAMTAEQIRGMNRFQTIGCSNCHSGPMFSDFKAHVLAVPDNTRLPASDAGVEGTYAFRTASLRNLASSAPYMHNGVFDDLNDVVNFYQRISGGRGGGGRGGRGINTNVARTQIDPLARQLNMRGGGGGGRGRNGDLVAFLGALNDESFDRTIPERVPSGLKVGGN
jgi:cytochrome c peroxidase